ncbi:MAG: glutaredoxin 3 [Pseudomonadota bacterium]
MTQVTIYTKDYCPYCKAAKQMLRAKGIDYTEFDVLQQPEKLQEMLDRSQRQTVPQIFFGDQHIGGYTDLVEYYRPRAA